jgi:hypothetical protein
MGDKTIPITAGIFVLIALVGFVIAGDEGRDIPKDILNTSSAYINLDGKSVYMGEVSMKALYDLNLLNFDNLKINCENNICKFKGARDYTFDASNLTNDKITDTAINILKDDLKMISDVQVAREMESKPKVPTEIIIKTVQINTKEGIK